jgi:hypothetical protein
LILILNLMIVGAASEAKLKAQAPAQACKSTVTGTLEMIPLESKVFGNKRLLRVWLRPATLPKLLPRSDTRCSISSMGKCFSTGAHRSRFQMSGMWMT